MTYFIILLALLQVKHFIIDYPLQTADQLVAKGKYGNLIGIIHSANHGLGTYMVFVLMGNSILENSIQVAALLGLLDAVIHYHIDWIKTRFGQKDIQKKSFWVQLGLDQAAHQLTYLGLFWLYFNQVIGK